MSLDEHRYALTVRWTGNLGAGTSTYRGYSRDHDVQILKAEPSGTFRPRTTSNSTSFNVTIGRGGLETRSQFTGDLT